jgi:diadenosine tetraphosphate (Ap4A) HIT family hydrolase
MSKAFANARTAIHRIVERCRSGDYPAAVAKLPSGWVIMGECQVLAGYCLLLPDPVVDHLNALSGAARARFLADMALTGDAVLACTGAMRVNYAVFGNVEPALHAHVFPRRANEPAETRTAQPWALDWSAAPTYSDAEYGELKNRLAAYLAGVEGG